MLHKILFIVFSLVNRAGFHTSHALASTGLHTVLSGWRAFDVSLVRKGDNHAIVGNQVLDCNLTFVRKDRTTTRSSVLRFNLLKFVFDDREYA